MDLNLPLLPLRDIVVFPGMIVPLFVGRDKSVVALEKAMAANKEIFLVAQLDPAEDDPDKDDSANVLRPDDAVSMHTTYERDLEGGREYADDFTDDEDAREQDVFEVGDGDDEGIWKQDGR